MQQVLITTQHRGVFVGEIPDEQDIAAKAMPLQNARMVIYWGTTKGLMQLCDTGPTGTTRISAPAQIPMLHDITAVFAVSEAAWAKFVAA